MGIQPAAQPAALPAAKQLAFMDWEFGVFFHFGIRAFYQGHKDWDMREMPLEGFNPVSLDCDQWISVSKSAGARYAILVCKHHDGFANWPSRYTEYSVANTPWKNGKGDVVGEFTRACRNHGLKIGLYYSPAEFGFKDKAGKDYDDYFINQVSELLGNYGTIDYLWFDGCGSEDHRYDTERIVAVIRKLQPGILLFNMWDPDTRWVGNESGYAHSPNINRVGSTDFSVRTEVKDTLGEKRFLPVECDFRMRLHNWFYSDDDEHTVKSVEELMGIYYYSVGRGANLLINIGPDRRGLLPDADARRLGEFGEEIRRRFSAPLPGEYVRESGACVFRSENPCLADHVVLTEDLTFDEPIEQFIIRAHPYSYGEPVIVYEGRSVGHKAICRFPPILTKTLEVIPDGNKADRISSMKVYKV
ncbi:MAG: alpha-L-fucosidase [Treponema sp.]|jgi:alpha-L-fucosidase|nr:alpha-L-fucosidase [Treponema sp.]